MWLTISSFLLVTAAIGFFTWLLVRKKESSSQDGFFLAGRKLTFPFIAGSLLLTNLSTEQLVGLNGSAFKFGFSVMVWEVLAVVALVIMALFFLPRFLRSGVTTVPEYLEQRFDRTSGTICNLIFLCAYAVILLPIILYTGAVGLGTIFDVKALFGLPGDTAALWFIVLLVGIIGSFYALFGGLRTVAVSDTLNGICLLTGGFMIVYFGLDAVAGGDGIFGGFEKLNTFMPERFNSIGGVDHEVPFFTVFSGVLFINIFYWCTNQQIIQRTFGASSLAEGQKGVLLTGLLKLLGPLYLVLPGLIAYYLFKHGIITPDMKPDGTPNSDQVYGLLVRKVLPAPLTGFFAAAMTGAILSSFNSALNASCTLFSLGVYKNLLHPDATEKQVVASSKIFGWILAGVSMGIAPLLAETGSIFNYLQTMNGIYFIPILAVVAVGMLTTRVPARAANIALLGGVAVIAVCYFLPPFSYVVNAMNGYMFLGLVFLYLVLFMLVYGAVRPLETEYVQFDAKIVDMIPYKHVKLCSILLLFAVLLFYILLSDFSVLR